MSQPASVLSPLTGAQCSPSQSTWWGFHMLGEALEGTCARLWSYALAGQ